jgi:hypothetical protein
MLFESAERGRRDAKDPDRSTQRKQCNFIDSEITHMNIQDTDVKAIAADIGNRFEDFKTRYNAKNQAHEDSLNAFKSAVNEEFVKMNFGIEPWQPFARAENGIWRFCAQG